MIVSQSLGWEHWLLCGKTHSVQKHRQNVRYKTNFCGVSFHFWISGRLARLTQRASDKIISMAANSWCLTASGKPIHHTELVTATLATICQELKRANKKHEPSSSQEILNVLSHPKYPKCYTEPCLLFKEKREIDWILLIYKAQTLNNETNVHITRTKSWAFSFWGHHTSRSALFAHILHGCANCYCSKLCILEKVHTERRAKSDPLVWQRHTEHMSSAQPPVPPLFPISTQSHLSPSIAACVCCASTTCAFFSPISPNHNAMTASFLTTGVTRNTGLFQAH